MIERNEVNFLFSIAFLINDLVRTFSFYYDSDNAYVFEEKSIYAFRQIKMDDFLSWCNENSKNINFVYDGVCYFFSFKEMKSLLTDEEILKLESLDLLKDILG